MPVQLNGADLLTSFSDVENGSWTPVITFNNLSTGQSASLAVGRYTKTGSLITIWGIIILTAKGSATGTARLAGLPFTVRNNNDSHAPAVLNLDVVSSADSPQAVANPNSVVVSFTEITDAGAKTVLTEGNFSDTSRVEIQFSFTI